MKPYLKAAEQLRQKGFENHEALVNAFSTTMFELQLFGKQSVGSHNKKRDYYKIMIIGFVFRGHVSQRVTQKGDYGFGMGGKVDMTFDAYTLNEEELKAAQKMVADANVEESLQFSMNVAEEALKELKEDLDYFLMSAEDKEKVKFESTKKKKESLDINPFAALFNLHKKEDKKKKDENVVLDPKEIKEDNFVERKLRAKAAADASSALHSAYDIYKKAHRMASAPGEGFDLHDAEAIDKLSQGGNVGFWDAFKSRSSPL